MMKALACAAAAVLAWQGAAMAQRSSHDHHHHASAAACAEPTLRCADKVTPTFASDGTLWLAFAAAQKVLVARSSDSGHSFAPPLSINAEPLELDLGPEARPKIAVDGQGCVAVAFAVFKDRALNGQVFHTRSTDGGKTFAPPRPITNDPESQRFETLAFDDVGSLFAAWLDKRGRAAARARNEKYDSAELAFAWSNDQGETLSDARIAQNNTCECCALAIAFAAAGRPVVAFRNIFEGGARDHAIVTFSDLQTPGPVNRVSVDDWRTDVCPHQGPSLAISPDGVYHVSWFTNGLRRKGLFYARSQDSGRTFSKPLAVGDQQRASSQPYLVALPQALWLAWKQFDGETTTVSAMVSHDSGSTWSAPRVVAQTADASDHPLLVTDGRHAFLSWQTRAQGYRLIELE